MRIAALYNICGNLPALQGVLSVMSDGREDAIVVGGDVVPGPMPRECLDTLHSLACPVHFIAGNGERDVLTLLSGAEPPRVPREYRDVVRWRAEQIGDDRGAR